MKAITKGKEKRPNEKDKLGINPEKLRREEGRKQKMEEKQMIKCRGKERGRKEAGVNRGLRLSGWRGRETRRE